MSKLLYSSSSDVLVTREDMGYLKTPEPMGSRHAPYSFADFSNTVCDEIVRSGFKIEREEFAITKDENRLFGLIHVSNGVDHATPTGETLPAIYKPQYNSVVGVCGAHDQKISRGLAIGSQVLCCSNLCFHGDLGNWHTRQTINIADRIPGLVAEAVDGLRDASETLTVDFDAFDRREITRDAGDSILLDIYRSGGFSASQLGRAIGDWDESSVDEHMANGRTLWWLFNSATASLKPTGASMNHNDLRERSTIVYRKVAQHNRAALAA